MDPQTILSAVLDQKEVSSIEALILMQEGDHILPEIFFVANAVNRRINQDKVSYLLGKVVNYTNVCKAGYGFGVKAVRRNDKRAYKRTPEELVQAAKGSGTIRQIVIQGGLNPDITIDQIIDYVAAIRDAFPDVHIQAASPVEIHYYSRRWRVPVNSILERLQDAGANSLSGAGAEILNDKLRKKVCPDILRTQDWVGIIRQAADFGFTASACMHFGHVEDEIHICEHFELIRQLQRETGVFTEFVPHLFHPESSRKIEEHRLNDLSVDKNLLKILAVARIYLGEDFPVIQAPWWSFGWDTVARAFAVGASDIGYTRFEESALLSEDAGKSTELTVTQLKKHIQKASRSPIERQPAPVEVNEQVKV